MSKLADYQLEICQLSLEDGCGFLISYSDFSECISDGEMVEEAPKNGRSALKATIAALKAENYRFPPRTAAEVSRETSSPVGSQ